LITLSSTYIVYSTPSERVLPIGVAVAILVSVYCIPKIVSEKGLGIKNVTVWTVGVGSPELVVVGSLERVEDKFSSVVESRIARPLVNEKMASKKSI
jgi:hypothetical protein